jgi:predicted nucleotide-binding protein (sugar kinase/HSP70/actin superfamily)
MLQTKDRVISFPHMGDYWIPFKSLMEVLDCRIIIPPPITKKTLELGIKHSPEFVCIPFKYNIGNYIESLEKGANFLVQAGGGCRFGYYAEVQKTILDDLGYDYEFYQIAENLNVLKIFKDFKIINPKLSKYQITMALLRTFKKLKVLDELDGIIRKRIGFEKRDGELEKIKKIFLIKLDKAKTFKEISNAKKETLNEIYAVELEKPKHLLRVGVVGELYVLMEPFSNFFIEKTLGKMGIEVHRHVTVSSILNESFFHNRYTNKFKKYAEPYLKYHIGAHGTESVGRANKMVKEGFDGVIHLKPFGCMPEINAMSAMYKIAKTNKFPIVFFSFDSQTSETGLKTRLEAFYDMILMKKNV